MKYSIKIDSLLKKIFKYLKELCESFYVITFED